MELHRFFLNTEHRIPGVDRSEDFDQEIDSHVTRFMLGDDLYIVPNSVFDAYLRKSHTFNTYLCLPMNKGKRYKSPAQWDAYFGMPMDFGRLFLKEFLG